MQTISGSAHNTSSTVHKACAPSVVPEDPLLLLLPTKSPSRDPIFESFLHYSDKLLVQDDESSKTSKAAVGRR